MHNQTFITSSITNNDQYNLTEMFSAFLNNNSSDLTSTDVFTEELAYVMNVYFTPALVILGTIGNFLSVIVFFKSKLKAQSTSQYLSALAISDTIFLLQLIPPWLKAVSISRVFARQGFCQCFVYLTYVSSSTSSWLVVSFTVERFVAVLYPLRTRMCTVRRARLVIFAITVTCLAINTPVLKFAVPKRSECNIDYELMDHAARFNVVDTIFSFTLPLTIITVLNIWIVVGVCRLSRVRGKMIKKEENKPQALRPVLQARGGNMVVRRSRSSLQCSQQRITRMLLIVSSVFVLLNLPAYSMRIVAYANNMSSYEYSGKWAALQQICLLFFNSNFGINFFLYCMTGQNFRRALCQTFSWLTRSWNALMRLICCSTDEHAPPPRPSVTNSISVNTNASATANSRLSLNGSIKRIFAISGSYLKLWRFQSLHQEKRQKVDHELQVHPARLFQSSSHQLERPIPRWPENSGRVNPPEPIDVTTFPRIPPQTFRPIPFNLVPGQIARLERSPSHYAARIESPPSTYTYGSPFTPNEFASFAPARADSAADAYPSLHERPQPPRWFSLPAQQCYMPEYENTPPELEITSPLPWPLPPESEASSSDSENLPALEHVPAGENIPYHEHLPPRKLSPATHIELSSFFRPQARNPSVSHHSPHASAFSVYAATSPACS